MSTQNQMLESESHYHLFELQNQNPCTDKIVDVFDSESLTCCDTEGTKWSL